MGSTIRTKVINGQEYLYEITYYYDPVTKRTRQRSRYLGKSIDGKPVRVRDAARTPRFAFAYGDYLPLLAVIDALRLDALLSEHFPGRGTDALTLALNRVFSPPPLSDRSLVGGNSPRPSLPGHIPLAGYPELPP